MTSRRHSILSAAAAALLLLLLFLLRLPPVSPATEKETELLLQFKGNVTADPGGALASWYAAPGSDPCRDFAGVTCGSSNNVEKIIIHKASLAGTLSAALAALPSLQIISLFGNRFSGGVPPEFAALTTLNKLNLSENELSGPVPPFLGNLPYLRLLDLSRNSFSGQIPDDFFKNCLQTHFVSLSHNKLYGPIPSSIANCSNLLGFDFSFNNLTGEFLPDICKPPAINHISLRNNSLSGTVADKVSMCKSLNLFDIGSNSFSGPVPFDPVVRKNVSYFDASSNRFQGNIPAFETCSASLNYFDASGNALDGGIPSSIANCRELKYLNLGFNNLSGGIPSGIGTLKSLNVLRLGNNPAIGGPIPPGLAGAELLQILDLRNLQLSGGIPDTLSQCRFLLELDLSANSLHGEIPATLYNITYLRYLDLHQNQLNGSIPAILGNLTLLQFLDLSENSLTGAIPDSLGNLALVSHLNVSYNNLSGAIPSSPAIQRFGPSAFSHNQFLCGSPLDNSCPGRRRTRLLSSTTIAVIAAAAAVLIAVGAVTVMSIRAKRRKTEAEKVLASGSASPVSTGTNAMAGKLVLFNKSLPSKYQDWEAGTKALLDKDCLVGDGSIGAVYKASLEGGVFIAVKKLETLGRIRSQDEFEQEMGRLGGLRHPNLVALQGYYWASTMQLILTEFVPNGSLYDHLHGSRVSYSGNSGHAGGGGLFWSRRFNIALGTARALAYLHHDCRPQVLHLNIKSSNVMLDEGYEAKLADYGMGKLLPILGGYSFTNKPHTSAGYVAPELASRSFRYSDKCDVYSFGVILLELVTGRKPVYRPGAATAAVVLRDYVRLVLEDGVAFDCFDRKLGGCEESELTQVLKLGLICTTEAPLRRPCMTEVVQVLESIKPIS